jgi:hypothetical protein
MTRPGIAVLLLALLWGADTEPQDTALLPVDSVRSERLPLPCPPMARLAAGDAKLRAAFFRMLAEQDGSQRVCVGVASRGQVLAPPLAFLEVLSRHAPAVGLCGCRPWEQGVRVIILPEMSRRSDGTLEFGTFRGSASTACTYRAHRDGTGWRIDGLCEVM